MLKKIVALGLTTAPILVNASGMSDVWDQLTERYYLGAGIGWSYLKPEPEENAPYTVSDSDGFAIRLQTGFLLTSKYSVDASLVSLGKAGVAADSDPNTTLTDIRYFAGTVGGVFRIWEYDHPYNLFAKIDATVLRTSTSNDTVPVNDVNIGSFGLGVGGTYRLNPAWQIRADFENYAQDMKTMTVGLEWSPAPKEKRAVPIDSDSDGITDKKDQCPDTPLRIEVDKTGCPIGEKASFLLKTQPIQFDVNATDLTQASTVELHRIADYLKSESDLQLRIEAHTDNIGNEQNNLVLSNKRAQAVKDYLIQQGVDAERMTVYGFGEGQPIADNNTPQGRAKNRRVEFKLINPAVGNAQ